MPQFLTNGATLMIAVLLVLAIAYRFYSAFLAAKVLALDPNRPTPAHMLNDGQNYHPTNKWVLFGHHFAAISGAGPLIGPVLAAQFGYMPGLLWILIGVCLAGAVQDFVVLVLSIRRNGKSLAQIAFSDVGPVSGSAATIGILFVLVIALAGLGKVVTKALGGDKINYDAQTRFVAASEDHPIVPRGSAGSGFRYTIPADATIIYPGGVSVSAGAQFDLCTETKGALPVDVEVSKYDPVSKKWIIPRGTQLSLPEGTIGYQEVAGSAWGTFTILLTIPIALFIGAYLYRIRKNRVVEASIVGGILTLGAVYLGGTLVDPASMLNAFADYFNVSETTVGIAIVVYGFVASILPVWLLLCPRDYLSSFLKIGTIALLVLGVIIAHPVMHAPAFNSTFMNGGPVVSGAIFPFVFITIMCGAISGFHALVSSGTTPKMINKETDARTIGYGAMLMEGLVGIVALIAASALPIHQYYNINTPAAAIPQFAQKIHEVAANDPMAKLDEPIPDVGEQVQGRTGGAVTLAIGMASILNDAVTNVIGSPDKPRPWLADLFRYWYHFAIMFEALFIMTTIDTGTRVGRFLLQETMGKWIHPRLGKTDWWPSAILATALISGSWGYFLAEDFDAIWSMFGIANQMLAVMALAVATAALTRGGKKRYAWVTVLPMCFVIITTGSASYIKLAQYFSAMHGAHPLNPIVSAVCVLAIDGCTAIVVINSLLVSRKAPPAGVLEPAAPVAAAVPDMGGA